MLGGGGAANVRRICTVPKETWCAFANHIGAIDRLLRKVQEGADAQAVGDLFAKVLNVDRSLVVFNGDDRRLRWKRDN